MDAAVLAGPGLPHFAPFPAPCASAGNSVIEVLAAGLNPVDVAIAAGIFPGVTPTYPSVAGHEGVGILDGRRMYFNGPVAPYGSMAQQVLVAPERTIELPLGIDDGVAAALGTAGMAGWLALSWRARLQPGETVLVLGATGVLGTVAVQAARILGAGRVVAAGRNAAGLRRLDTLGADATVDVSAGSPADSDLPGAFRKAAVGDVDVIIDPVWGEQALAALQAAAPFARLVQIGNAGSPTASIPAGVIRRFSASILGYTNLMVPAVERATAYATMAGHAAAGRLVVDVEHLPLSEVRTAWALQNAVPHRKLVLVP